MNPQRNTLLAGAEWKLQDNLEVGDVSILPTLSSDYAERMTYTPERGLLQWFEFPISIQRLDALTANPKHRTLTALSPPKLACKP